MVIQLALRAGKNISATIEVAAAAVEAGTSAATMRIHGRRAGTLVLSSSGRMESGTTKSTARRAAGDESYGDISRRQAASTSVKVMGGVNARPVVLHIVALQPHEGRVETAVNGRRMPGEVAAIV